MKPRTEIIEDIINDLRRADLQTEISIYFTNDQLKKYPDRQDIEARLSNYLQVREEFQDQLKIATRMLKENNDEKS